MRSSCDMLARNSLLSRFASCIRRFGGGLEQPADLVVRLPALGDVRRQIVQQAVQGDRQPRGHVVRPRLLGEGDARRRVAPRDGGQHPRISSKVGGLVTAESLAGSVPVHSWHAAGGIRRGSSWGTAQCPGGPVTRLGVRPTAAPAASRERSPPRRPRCTAARSGTIWASSVPRRGGWSMTTSTGGRGRGSTGLTASRSSARLTTSTRRSRCTGRS